MDFINIVLLGSQCSVENEEHLTERLAGCHLTIGFE
jgi:hypothetical protein